MKISRKEAVNLILETRKSGAFFGVVFIKRSSGESRKMNCRLNVQKHLAGGEAAYNFEQKGLIPVYDVIKKGYRSIPYEGIRKLKINGKEYEVI